MLNQDMDEPAVDIIKETKKYEDKNILPVIKPKTSVNDIRLMATQEIKEIKTYLLPALIIKVEIGGVEHDFLFEKIKGKLIVNPEKEIIRAQDELYAKNAFYGKPEYLSIKFDKQLKEKMTTETLDPKLCRLYIGGAGFITIS